MNFYKQGHQLQPKTRSSMIFLAFSNTRELNGGLRCHIVQLVDPAQFYARLFSFFSVTKNFFYILLIQSLNLKPYIYLILALLIFIELSMIIWLTLIILNRKLRTIYQQSQACFSLFHFQGFFLFWLIFFLKKQDQLIFSFTGDKYLLALLTKLQKEKIKAGTTFIGF